MKKKKGGGGGANWMDTYGDMVTLLLCFFVLLYSMSTISQEKFKAIVQSFNPNASRVETATPGGDGPNADDNNPGGVFDNPSDEEAQEDIEDMMQALYEALNEYSKQEGIDSAVSVEMYGGEIYLKFSDRVFFAGDSYTLRQEAREILTSVCGILDKSADAIEQIRVEGHTAQEYADRPNETRGDRRLASNRALEVVIFLQENCSIHPARICNVGWGQWHAIADNQTEDGRAPNRRVEMVISARDLEAEELGESLAQFITSDTEQDGTGETDQGQAQ